MTISPVTTNNPEVVKNQSVEKSYIKKALIIAGVALAAIAIVAIVGAMLHPAGAAFVAGMAIALSAKKIIVISIAAVGLTPILLSPLVMISQKIQKLRKPATVKPDTTATMPKPTSKQDLIEFSQTNQTPSSSISGDNLNEATEHGTASEELTTGQEEPEEENLEPLFQNEIYAEPDTNEATEHGTASEELTTGQEESEEENLEPLFQNEIYAEPDTTATMPKPTLKQGLIDVLENQEGLLVSSAGILTKVTKLGANSYELTINPEKYPGEDLKELSLVNPYVALENLGKSEKWRLKSFNKLEFRLGKISSNFFVDALQRDLRVKSLTLPDNTQVNCDLSSSESKKLTKYPEIIRWILSSSESDKFKKSLDIIRSIQGYVNKAMPEESEEYKVKVANTLLYYCSQQFYTAIGFVTATPNNYVLTQGIGTKEKTDFSIKFERSTTADGEMRFKASLDAKQALKVLPDDFPLEFANIDFKFAHEFTIPRGPESITKDTVATVEQATITFV